MQKGKKCHQKRKCNEIKNKLSSAEKGCQSPIKTKEEQLKS